MKTYTQDEIIANNVGRLDCVHEFDEVYDECDPDEAAYYAAVYSDKE